jgi:hypothetical protein
MNLRETKTYIGSSAGYGRADGAAGNCSTMGRGQTDGMLGTFSLSRLPLGVHASWNTTHTGAFSERIWSGSPRHRSSTSVRVR